MEARNQTDELLSTEDWLNQNRVTTSKEEGGIDKWRKKYGYKEKDGETFILPKYDYDSKTGLKLYVNPDLPAGHVEPRPEPPSFFGPQWDRIWSNTHNPDGTPKQQ